MRNLIAVLRLCITVALAMSAYKYGKIEGRREGRAQGAYDGMKWGNEMLKKEKRIKENEIEILEKVIEKCDLPESHGLGPVETASLDIYKNIGEYNE